MKRLALTLALAAVACASAPESNAPATPPDIQVPIGDVAGNRMEALMEARGSLLCTPDHAWCLTKSGTVGVSLYHGASGLMLPAPDEATSSGWPFIVRLTDGRVIVGSLDTQSQMYSGGGASATTLTLFTIETGPPDGLLLTVTPVLTAPMTGAASIRACFSEADMRERRQACSDEYALAGALSLDPTASGEAPRFILETQAATFPGRVSRYEDSTAAPPLRASDLRWWQDERCSYRRVYAFDATTGRYAPDAPLPPCADYLEP